MITDENKNFLLKYSPDHKIRHDAIDSGHLSYRQRTAISKSPYMNGELADRMFNSPTVQGDKFNLIRDHFDNMHPDTKDRIINSSYHQKAAFAGTSDHKIIDHAVEDPNNHYYLALNSNLQPHHIDKILDHMNQNSEKYDHSDLYHSIRNLGVNHEFDDSQYQKFKEIALKHLSRHDMIEDMKYMKGKNGSRLADLESAFNARSNKKSILDIKKP